MDALDRDIVCELQESYSLTPKVTEIAKRLGKSSTTIHSRIKRLERSGMIRGYSAHVDEELAGKKLRAFYFIKTQRGQKDYIGDMIAEKLLEHPNVMAVHNTMGEWDLMVEFIGKDSDDYLAFMRSTEPLEGIKETKGKYILKTYPAEFRLVPEE